MKFVIYSFMFSMDSEGKCFVAMWIPYMSGMIVVLLVAVTSVMR